MQRPPTSFPLRNYLVFVALSFAILTAYTFFVKRFLPPPPAQIVDKAAAKGEKAAEGKQPAAAQAEKGPPAKAEAESPQQKPTAAKPKQPPPAKPAQPAAKKIGVAWVAIGSADEASPYRMLVTFCNRGAAMARIELSNRRYHDLDDRSGYLGHVVMEEDFRGDGAPVQVVGQGTPAAKVGLKPGDRIIAVGGQPVANGVALQKALRRTKPNRPVELTVVRDGKEMTLSPLLGWRPLEVVRPERRNPKDVTAGDPEPDALNPEKDCPLSMLATLEQIDNQRQSDDEKAEGQLESELPGVQLRNANWEVAASAEDSVVFRRTLPDRGLEITKTYRLAKTAEGKGADNDFPAYHLVFEIQVKNIGDRPHKVAYRLDGPNGLPREGWWYSYKVSRTWGSTGLRDLIVKFDPGETQTVGCPVIADDKSPSPWRERLTFIGVDAVYFSAVMIPQGEAADDIFQSMPLRVGEVDPLRKNITNVSLRLVSKPRELKPGEAVADVYKLFAGPKKPPLLAAYNLGDVLYYGWFGFVAEPMLWTLHLLYAVLRNYGLAIVMLTVTVRLCMFPFSRKQALSAPENADHPAGAGEAQGEIQEQHAGAAEGPAGDLPQAQLPPDERLPRGAGANADLSRPVSLADGQRRAARRAADYGGGPLVLEPGRPGHALRLALLHAGHGHLRRWHVRPGPVFQHSSRVHRRADDPPNEDVHAAGHGRAIGDATEGHAIHDGLHGHHVLQGGQRLVPVPRRYDPVGVGRAEVPAQDRGGRGGGRAVGRTGKETLAVVVFR